MTPRQLKIIFVSFAVLVVGVAANIVLLQPMPVSGQLSRPQAIAVIAAARTDPLTLRSSAVNARRGEPMHRSNVAPAVEEGVRRFARLRPDAAFVDQADDTFPDAPNSEGDPSTIAAVQRELAARGYGDLLPDGVPGVVTRAAIMAFEYDHKMPLKGEATSAVLTRIVLGAAGDDILDPAARRIRSPAAEIVMRTVQQSLATLDYPVGKIDGRMGDDIARAIREFELDQGLKPTGRISADVFTRLARVVGSASAKRAP